MNDNIQPTPDGKGVSISFQNVNSDAESIDPPPSQDVFITVANFARIYADHIDNSGEPGGFPKRRYWQQQRANVFLKIQGTGIPEIRLGGFNAWYSCWKWRFVTDYLLWQDAAKDFPALDGLFEPEDYENTTSTSFASKYVDNRGEALRTPESGIFVIEDMWIATAFRQLPRDFLAEALNIFENSFTDLDDFIIVPIRKLSGVERDKMVESLTEVGYWNLDNEFLVKDCSYMYIQNEDKDDK